MHIKSSMLDVCDSVNTAMHGALIFAHLLLVNKVALLVGKMLTVI